MGHRQTTPGLRPYAHRSAARPGGDAPATQAAWQRCGEAVRTAWRAYRDNRDAREMVAFAGFIALIPVFTVLTLLLVGSP